MPNLRKLCRRVVPAVFWPMGILGSLLLLSNFALGKNDSVGILPNLFPAAVTGYDQNLDFRPRRDSTRRVSSIS